MDTFPVIVMEPSVFETLEHCLAGNRAPGWARRSQRPARRQTPSLFDANASSSLRVSQRRRSSGGRNTGVDVGSLGSPAGLFGRSHSRSLTPMHASRVTYSGVGSSQSTKVRRRWPSASSPAASPVSAPAVKPPIRPKLPSKAAMDGQTPLPADFLELPWVQRYLNETKGVLSVLTLESLAARWELERTNPEEAKAQAKARAERSPAAQARRRKSEKAQRHRARMEQQRAKETARLERLQAEHQKQMQAEEEAVAAVALAQAASAAAASQHADQEAAVEAQRRKSELQRVFESSATMIQKVYRGKAHRKQHEALLQTPIVVVSIIGGPGSGKTTLCKQLAADESLHSVGVSLCHLSTGSLLRTIAQPRSRGVQHPHAEMIRIMMEGGELVPDNIVCDILQKEITKFRYRAGQYAGCAALQTSPPTGQLNLVLLDGFPVNVEQANMLDETPLASVRLPPRL